MNASTAETTFMRAVLWLFNFDDYVTIFYNNEWYLEHTTLSSFYADLDEQLIDLEKKNSWIQNDRGWNRNATV